MTTEPRATEPYPAEPCPTEPYPTKAYPTEACPSSPRRDDARRATLTVGDHVRMFLVTLTISAGLTFAVGWAVMLAR